MLKQQLDALNSDYAVLQMQSQELLVRAMADTHKCNLQHKLKILDSYENGIK